MKKLILILMLALVWDSSQAQSFDNFSNFQIANGKVFWQTVYQVPDVSRDSIIPMILSALKTDNAFKLVSKSEDEAIFELDERVLKQIRGVYSRRVIYEARDGKCRVTFCSIYWHRRPSPSVNAI